MAKTVVKPRERADSAPGFGDESRECDRQPGDPRKIHHGPETSFSLAEDTVAGYFGHVRTQGSEDGKKKIKGQPILLLTEESR